MGRYFTRTRWLVTAAAVLFQSYAHAERPSASILEAQPLDSAKIEAELPLLKKKKLLFQHSSYSAAWKAAQESNRPILVYVTMPGCPYCVKMLRQTYRLPEVGRLVSDSFETVYVSRRAHPKLVKKLHIKLYPTTVLVGVNNKVLDVIEGYVDAKTFRRRLQTGLASVATTTQTR